MINPRGGYQQLDFYFGDETEVYHSCSLQWKNQYYVFGGNDERTQAGLGK